MKSADAVVVINAVMDKFGISKARWGFLVNPARVAYIADNRRGLPTQYEIRLKKSWSADTITRYLTDCLIAQKKGGELPGMPKPVRATQKKAKPKAKPLPRRKGPSKAKPKPRKAVIRKTAVRKVGNRKSTTKKAA